MRGGEEGGGGGGSVLEGGGGEVGGAGSASLFSGGGGGGGWPGNLDYLRSRLRLDGFRVVRVFREHWEDIEWNTFTANFYSYFLVERD